MKTDYDFRLPQELFAPEIVLAAMEELRADTGRTTQRMREARIAAVATKGFSEARSKQYFLALPDADPPDFYMSEAPGPEHPGYVSIENKSITNHNRQETEDFSPDGLARFIKECGQRYAFTDPLVTLVVHLNFDHPKVDVAALIDAITAALRPSGIENAIWLVTQIGPARWWMAYVYPGRGQPVDFVLRRPSGVPLEVMQRARRMIAHEG